MNRSDEIQAVARTIAEQVHTDPADFIQRNQLADELIKLVTLVVAAVGKSVAIDGESNMNEVDSSELQADLAHSRYLVGEAMQTGARWVEENAMGADLERYERDGLKPAWTPARTPAVTHCGDCTHSLAEHHKSLGCMIQDDEDRFCRCESEGSWMPACGGRGRCDQVDTHGAFCWGDLGHDNPCMF